MNNVCLIVESPPSVYNVRPLLIVTAKESLENVEAYTEKTHQELSWFTNYGFADPKTWSKFNLVVYSAHDYMWTARITGNEGPDKQFRDFCLNYTISDKNDCHDLTNWQSIDRDHQGCEQRRKHYQENPEKLCTHRRQKGKYVAALCMLLFPIERFYNLNRLIIIALMGMALMADREGQFDVFQKFFYENLRPVGVKLTKDKETGRVILSVTDGNDRRILAD